MVDIKMATTMLQSQLMVVGRFDGKTRMYCGVRVCRLVCRLQTIENNVIEGKNKRWSIMVVLLYLILLVTMV